MRRLVLSLLLLLALIAAALAWITRPRHVAAAEVAGLTGDPVHGEQVFLQGGCASCHMAEGATGTDRMILSGGQRFPSPFGTFRAPNISPDPEFGIGGWSVADLASAMREGTSPQDAHLYPAFPYASYARVSFQDIADLHAYLMTLPPDQTPSQPHELGFPFNIRAGLGLWKLLFLDRDWVVSGQLTAEEERGRYLVEALSHCGECHTPRGPLGEMERSRWLAGAEKIAPDITPQGLGWTEDEIAELLSSGFTPEFDSVGGHMALIVDNYSRLPQADRDAVAAYLLMVPPAQ